MSEGLEAEKEGDDQSFAHDGDEDNEKYFSHPIITGLCRQTEVPYNAAAFFSAISTVGEPVLNVGLNSS